MDALALFKQESRQLHHQRVSFILLTAIGVMLLFAALDLFLVPAYFSELFRYRLVAVGICGLLLVANHYDRSHCLPWAIGCTGYLAVGVVILLTVHRLGGVTSSSYVGLIVAMTFYTALAPLTVVQTLISGFTLVTLYVLSLLFVEQALPADQWLGLFNNLFFMACFVLIAATQSWTDTAARRRECMLRAAESEAAEALDYQASTLEQEVKRRTEAQKAMEKHYQALYEAIADDVVLLDPQGVLLQANNSYLRHFSDGELHPGTSFFDVVSAEDRERMRAALTELVSTGTAPTHLQLTLVMPQGTTMATELSGALLRRGEAILGAQLVIRDIGVRNALEKQLINSLRQVKQTENAAILALAKLSEYRDINPGHHLERIREYCKTLAVELAQRHPYAATVTPEYVQNLYQGAILHDIGMVAVADDIRARTGPLSVLEDEALRNHTLSGGDVIKAMEQEARGSGFLSLAKNIAYFHHERWDGQGYPYGLQGTEIPLEARIMAVADAYEEWTAALAPSMRLTHAQAIDAIVQNSGQQFDPIMVDVFLMLHEAFDQIRHELAEPVPSD